MNTNANTPPQPPPEPLHPERLTWAALLGRWIDFARSSLALPTTGEGKKLRESVPDIVMLQAVWFALQDVAKLDASERALARNRAAVLIDKHTAAMEKRWPKGKLPEQLRELIADAHAALESTS